MDEIGTTNQICSIIQSCSHEKDFFNSARHVTILMTVMISSTTQLSRYSPLYSMMTMTWRSALYCFLIRWTVPIAESIEHLKCSHRATLRNTFIATAWANFVSQQATIAARRNTRILLQWFLWETHAWTRLPNTLHKHTHTHTHTDTDRVASACKEELLSNLDVLIWGPSTNGCCLGLFVRL